MAVSGCIHSHRPKSGVVVAGLRRDFPCNRKARRLEVEHPDHRLEQRCSDITSSSGPLPFMQGNENAHCELEAGGDIRDRNAGTDGSLAGNSRDAHHAAEALRDLINSAAIGVGALLSEARD